MSASGLAVRGSAYAADRDFKEGLVRAVARPGAAAGRNSIPDYACRRSLRAVVDAGSIPAASIIRLNQTIRWLNSIGIIVHPIAESRLAARRPQAARVPRPGLTHHRSPTSATALPRQAVQAWTGFPAAL